MTEAGVEQWLFQSAVIKAHYVSVDLSAIASRRNIFHFLEIGVNSLKESLQYKVSKKQINSKQYENQITRIDKIATRIQDDIKNLLPTRNELLRERRALPTIDKSLEKHVDYTGQTHFESIDWSRLRYGIKVSETFSKLPLDMSYCFQIYYNALPKDRRDKMLDIITELGILEGINREVILSRLSALSVLAKRGQDDVFDSDWKDLVDLHTMQDFMKEFEPQKEIEELNDWVGVVRPHKLMGSEELFLEQFYEMCLKFLNKAPVKQRRPPELGGFRYIDLKEYSESPWLWGKPGSTSSTRLKVKDLQTGKIVQSSKTKWSSALALPAQSIYKKLTTNKKQEAYSIMKRERGKVRPVIMSDLETHLKMDFVAITLEHELRGHPNCTLFMSTDSLAQEQIYMAEETRNPQGVNIPIDQSHFDRNVNTKMVLCALDAISTFLRQRDVPNLFDIEETIERIKYAVTGGYLYVQGKTILIKNGVLSGWRLTALMDSLVSAAEIMMFDENLRKKGVSDSLYDDFLVQGDDVRARSRSFCTCVMLWNEYRLASLDVHPKKFFIKRAANEFLRQVAFKGRNTGYPARAVGSLVWRSPLTTEKQIGEARASEQVRNWSTLMGRIGTMDARNMMIDDIERGNKWSREVVLQLLATPTVVGGLGLDWPYNGQGWLRIGPSTFKRTWQPIDNFPGLVAVTKKFGLKGGSLDKFVEGNITTNKRDKIVTAATLVSIPVQNGITTVGSAIKTGVIRRVASYRSDVPQIVIDYILDTWGPEVVRELLTIDSQPVYDHLKQHASKGIMIGWLKGDLPFSQPVLPYMHPVVSAMLFNKLADWWWGWCLERDNLTFDTVRRAAISCFQDMLINYNDGAPQPGIITGP